MKKIRRKRFYMLTVDSWDCNRHPYQVWNIVDKEQDKVVAQGWDKPMSKIIVDLLNNKKEK